MPNKREVIAFTKTVSPGQTITLKERVKGAGTVEKLYARFYPGQERALQVLPVVVHAGGLTEPIVHYATGTNVNAPNGWSSTNYLAGDDDTINFDTSIAVDLDEEIWVTATNTSSSFVYDLVVYVMIDYLGGQLRA